MLQPQIICWVTRSFILLCFFISISVNAAPEFPKLDERVVDTAGLLSTSTRDILISELAAHERGTSNQVVVVTLTSLQGYSIDDFGNQLGRHWGIGQKERDNGVLLIVAPNERKVRIEVGYGLEGVLTDALSHNIIQTVILPQFKKGDMPQGIVNGARAIVQALEGTFEPMTEKKDNNQGGNVVMLFVFLIGFGEMVGNWFNSRRRSAGVIGVVAFVAGWVITGLLIFGIILAFFAMAFHIFIGGGGSGGSGSGGYGSGGFGSGGYSGGGFSGGGGSFGGGGASGGW